MDYKILRLKNGEDILGGMKGESRDHYIIHRPWQLSRIPTGLRPSEAYLAFSDWIPYSPQLDYEIQKSEVLIIVSCKDEIIEFYKKLLESKNSRISFKSFDDAMTEKELDNSNDDYINALKEFEDKIKH
tara:strand:+ start:16077 stop:16463 length:387 start_codon:yes stop_codon:yes gene_type:complete